MLTTCVTVSVIFVMLMYEISYSLKESMNDVADMSVDDPTSYVSSIRDWGPVSYGCMEDQIGSEVQEYTANLEDLEGLRPGQIHRFRHLQLQIVTFYPNDQRQQTYIVISNNSDRKVMFKMKSTRPGVYKMKPVFGIISPKEKFSIRIAYMGIKLGHRIPLNDRITVVLASVAHKSGERDKNDAEEGEMRKRRLDILFKGVNDQKAEPEAEGDAQKKPSAEKPAEQGAKSAVNQQAYMNGYEEGYKAALLEGTESKASAGPAKALEDLQKTKGIGKEPGFQEGFTEGYKKATALLKVTEKKGTKESAEKPGSKEKKSPSKEPTKVPSKETAKAPSKEAAKEAAVASKERLKGPVKGKSKEKARPSKEAAKAPSKEKHVQEKIVKVAKKVVKSREVAKAPSKEKAKELSKEPAKAPSKEVMKAPSKEPVKPVAEQVVKTPKKPKVASKEVAKVPSKEVMKAPSKESAKLPSKEPAKELIKEQEKIKEEVKKEEKVEKETKLTDGTNVMAMTPGGTDPSLGDPLKRKDIVHIGPMGKKQIVIVMYRDPRVPETLLSRSGDEDEDDVSSGQQQPPLPPQ